MRWRRALAVAVAVTLAGCATTDDSSRWPEMMVDDLTTGRPASSANLVATAPGRVSVISVWAVWCEPCRRELPMVADLGRDRSDVVTVGGVNHGDDPDRARAFLAEVGAELASLRDPDGRLVTALEVASLPATFVVDHHGRIVWRRLGVVERAEVEVAVDAALQESDLSPIDG